MNKFITNLINSGNFFLHLMLGSGIAMLLLKWERDFIGQIGICIFIPLVVCGFLEYFQGVIPETKRNMFDVLVSGIGGFITVLFYLLIYGFKSGYAIQSQEPKMFWYYAGWILITVSILIWVFKQIIKKFKK